jgi:hypothetical protein
MSITLKDGGTTATTGGVDQSFDQTPLEVVKGRNYADVSEPDYRARQQVVVTAREPKLQADGNFSKMRIRVQFVSPKTRDDGTIAYNIGRAEVEYDVESTEAEVSELREMAAQCAISAVFDDVYTAGTLPS